MKTLVIALATVLTLALGGPAAAGENAREPTAGAPGVRAGGAPADLGPATDAWKAEDYATAAARLQTLAADADADAQFLLGVLYDRGLGVPEDKQMAAYWYGVAAEQGHGVSRSALGAMHVLGLGVPKDDREAAEWFRRAGEPGPAYDQFNLGSAFHAGSGVAQNFELAAKWYRRAAERGLAEAQFQLASMCFFGQGVDEDYVEAYYWFTLAGRGGIGRAAEIRQLLERLMTPAQLAEAAQMVRQAEPPAATEGG